LIDHIGVIRKRLTHLEAEIDQVRAESVALQSAGRVLADFIQILADGGTASRATEVKIRAALNLVGRVQIKAEANKKKGRGK
jgi:hypothetical protein